VNKFVYNIGFITCTLCVSSSIKYIYFLVKCIVIYTSIISDCSPFGCNFDDREARLQYICHSRYVILTEWLSLAVLIKKTIFRLANLVYWDNIFSSVRLPSDNQPISPFNSSVYAQKICFSVISNHISVIPSTTLKM